MLLRNVLEEVVAARDLERITEQQYTRSLNSFELFLERQATIRDLDIPTINRWIKWLQESRGAVTCSNYKTGLLVLWNYLAEQRLIEPYTAKSIRQPRKSPNVVVSWTTDEIKALLASTDDLDGYLNNGIQAKVFMRAWILVGFETGLRPGDIRRLKIQDLDLEAGTISITQHKTRNPHVARISPHTVAAIRKLPLVDEVFPLGKTGVRKWELKLYGIAKEKFGFKRKPRSGIGTLRKSHATEVYASHGIAAAAQSLGHASGIDVAKKHYVDTRVQNIGILPKIDLHVSKEADTA